MSARERFRAAASGEQLAFAPILWDHVAELVRQPAPQWWKDATAATLILDDAAALAGADAVVVCALDAAVAELQAGGIGGDEAGERLADAAPIRAAIELVERLVLSGSRAVVAALPAIADLQRRLAIADPDIAEDAFTDLARACFEVAADGLAVLGSDEAVVRAAAGRAGSLGRFFGRPVLGAVLRDGAPAGWIEERDDVTVGFVADDGSWPAQRAGIVSTAGDVSGRWTVEQLRACGGARP